MSAPRLVCAAVALCGLPALGLGAGGACARHDPRCEALRERLVRCDDPQGAAALRCDDIPADRLACGSIDPSAPEGCRQFMACLYDGL